MMRRALIWLNPYGREAVRHKLKNGLKTQKRHFLAVSDLMSDSHFNVLRITLVYQIEVQDQINVQVEKFLENIKRAGKNRPE